MNTDEKTSLKTLYHMLVEKNDNDVLPYLHVLGELVGQNTDYITLKSLLASEQWPEAIDHNLICAQDSETDKISRAEGILELLVEKDLKDKKFLDFGCGEGHVAYKALSQNPVVSIGYDIAKNAMWEKFGTQNKLILTDNIADVEQYAPFDVVLLYDVIDHVSQEDAIKLLKKVSELIEINGTIYLRAHPFCSRHATHLYQKINKAFIHLVFTSNELNDMGYESPVNAHITHPIAQYGELFSAANLTVSHHNILREKVESFFKKTSIVKERVRMHYKESKDKLIRNGAFPEFQCEQQFLDYVLKRSEK
jgi:2-polyprenyl-3-methyl-5-hydroxy-6-metoxy-1,4-benzoquinol methylase